MTDHVSSLKINSVNHQLRHLGFVIFMDIWFMMPKLLCNRYMCPLVFQVPPPTLGIRVIGVNMIHGVPDKLNIYVKRVLEGSVAGLDGRIRVNDHIVEVRITVDGRDGWLS
jgi:hypothetical protein